MSFASQDSSDEVLSEINMTPLVDVMLVLLIIFIITIPVVQHAVKVQLPRASSAPSQPPPAHLQLSVAQDGQLFLGQTALALDALEAALRTHAAQEPQPLLFIRGDQQVPYTHVVQAMSAAQRSGLQRIGFVTEAHAP